nr:MAG TPA: minor capsid protein [Caudoviricetes sp.]
MAKKKRIKLNDQQLMLMADNVSDIYRQLCNDLFDNVVERLHDRGTYYLDQQPYLWQLEKMADVGMLNNHNIKLIAEYSGIAEKQIRYIIENEGYQVYKDTHAQLNSNAYNYKVMKDLISYSNQAVNDVHNLINTTLPKSVQATYKDIIETTVAKVITGMATPQKALDETIMKFQERGFYGYTDRAGRRQRADAYARTVIKTTARRTFNEMRMRPAQELGIDTFYYSIKAAAREMCAPLQNQIVTTGRARTEEGVKIFAIDDYGYGKPGGCQGVNCGHTMTPFIPGVNYMPDIDDDLKNLTEEQAIENANVQSKQRAMERAIRVSKERLHVAETMHNDELTSKYKTRLTEQKRALKSYVDKYPFLYRDRERERYYDDPLSKTREAIRQREILSKKHA